MIQFPNAKINIGLHITNRLPDAYHEIETVFYPVPLTDILEIIPAQDFLFQSTGLEIGGKREDNLVLQAYHLLQNDFELPAVHIHLHKMIPMGAGLGGGSSDAAFTLKMLNQLFSLQLSAEKLENYARKLGADCAFFIQNKPAYAYGRGDRFDRIELDLSKYLILIIKPSVDISTAWAFARIKAQKPSVSLQVEIQKPVANWQKSIVNDFQIIMERKYCKIRKSLELFKKWGALYTSLSGSGSAVYGIFEKMPDIDTAHLPGKLYQL